MCRGISLAYTMPDMMLSVNLVSRMALLLGHSSSAWVTWSVYPHPVYILLVS
jgi:hypothetical protein